MDRDFLIDLFADFGPVTIRRMFSGFGISADGTNFALALRAGLYFRADEQTIPQFEAEGSKPFSYQTRAKTVDRELVLAVAGAAVRRFGRTGGMGEGGAGRGAARGAAQAAEGEEGGEEGWQEAAREEARGKKKKHGEAEEVVSLRSRAASRSASRRMAASTRAACVRDAHRARSPGLTHANSPSRHLAVGLGGVFRIDFADHAVAAVALGGVEAGVGALDQRIRVVARLQHGDADRDGDAAENFAGRFLLQFLRHHGAADVVGDRQRLAQRRVRAAPPRIPRRRSGR